jgi:phosphonate transport system permease protein
MPAPIGHRGSSVTAAAMPELVWPRKPRPSLFGIVAGTAGVLMTVATLADWRYGTGFSFGAVITNLTGDNEVLSRLLHPDWNQVWSARTRAAFMQTLYLAVLGTVAGAIVSLPIALWSTRIGAPNRSTRIVVRTLSNINRAFPDIGFALVFVAVVGIGTLAGFLALFFFSIAVVTKLTSDTLDGIDTGPIEAATAAGARHNQMLRSAVVPQILPAYTSYVLYGFELNLRASAVIGLVGAGGIGQRLNSFRANYDWESVSAIVVLFILVVFIVDRLSTLLRRRLV